jgi:hypothetical protein
MIATIQYTTVDNVAAQMTAPPAVSHTGTGGRLPLRRRIGPVTRRRMRRLGSALLIVAPLLPALFTVLPGHS